MIDMNASATYSWDQELYESCKQIAKGHLKNVPWCYEGTPTQWIMGQVELMKELATEDSFEEAQAIKDAIKEVIADMQTAL